MGAICAPDYANIFMENFELKNIYPYIKDKKCSLGLNTDKKQLNSQMF